MPTASVRSGAGEPLLLIHPFMLSHDVWADVVPALATEFDVAAITLPGHWGGPRLRRRDVSVEAFADGLEAVLDELGWDTCHVAGNSIGGWLALELARRGRARSVTAIAPAGGWTRVSLAQVLVGAKFTALAPLAMLGHLTGDLGARLGLVRRAALRVVSARPGDVSRARAEGFLRATTHCSAFLPYIWSDLRRGGVRDLDLLSVPVQLVLCDDEWLLPPERYGRLYLEGRGDADVVRLPDGGHVPMYDDPDLLAALVAQHARVHGTAARRAETA
ncbi:alpha/beta hydrolase [soil metagenome]